MNVEPSLCPNGCGKPGPHFVPPSFGEPGFYHCTPLVPTAPEPVMSQEWYPLSYPILPEKKAHDLHRDFVSYPSPLLEHPSRPVTREEMALLTPEFVQEMVRLCVMRHGYSIAGVQVGMLRRFFVFSPHHTINDGQPYPTLWINPRIVQASEEKAYLLEGCLSMMGGSRKEKHLAHLTRPAAVVVECDGQDGTPWRFGCSGLMARVVQHEIDHLDGVLFTSRLNPIEFEKMRPLLRTMTTEHNKRMKAKV